MTMDQSTLYLVNQLTIHILVFEHLDSNELDK